MKIMRLSKKVAMENINRLIDIGKVVFDDPWGADNFFADFNRKWEFSLIALEDDQIVGFLICSVNANSLHIHRIAISPNYMRKKIGTTLINHVFNDARESGIKSVTLKVKKFNLAGQQFYKKLGFKKMFPEGTRYFYKKVI